jgi:hypothetical protein
LSSKEVRNLKEELRMVLRLATEGTSVYDEDVELEVEEEECRREAWGLRGGVGLFPPSGGEVDVADAFRSFQVSLAKEFLSKQEKSWLTERGSRCICAASFRGSGDERRNVRSG